MASKKLSTALGAHVVVALIKPIELSTFVDKQKFVRDAVHTMQSKGGIATDAAHLIAHHVTAFKDINWSMLRHGLSKMGYKHVDQILETADDILAFTYFETTKGQKYALDLPGMETLRGGGGGYPGGMDIDPMSWQVKNPGPGEPDQNQLQTALQENLTNQSVPFEQAAPKINIELDPESKKITIDYGQEEPPPIELEGASPTSSEAVPQPGGVTGPQAGKPEEPNKGASDFNGMDIPVNF
jgi:hypothetical protein